MLQGFAIYTARLPVSQLAVLELKDHRGDQ